MTGGAVVEAAVIGGTVAGAAVVGGAVVGAAVVGAAVVGAAVAGGAVVGAAVAGGVTVVGGVVTAVAGVVAGARSSRDSANGAAARLMTTKPARAHSPTWIQIGQERKRLHARCAALRETSCCGGGGDGGVPPRGGVGGAGAYVVEVTAWFPLPALVGACRARSSNVSSQTFLAYPPKESYRASQVNGCAVKRDKR